MAADPNAGVDLDERAQRSVHAIASRGSPNIRGRPCLTAPPVRAIARLIPDGLPQL
jgi:hypothetical protein